MNAYFCEKTGVRIVRPGVSKAVDQVNGQDDYIESVAPHGRRDGVPPSEPPPPAPIGGHRQPPKK